MAVQMSGGPDRIYDKEAAAMPLPPKNPLGFCPPAKPEQDPILWEGQD